MVAVTPAVAIQIARLPAAEGLPLPSRATASSAGYDLCAAVECEVVVPAGGRVLVPTGYRISIPPGYEGQIRPRSGLALSHGVLIPNSPGTIDSDYRGELKIILLNCDEKPYVVRRGDRIAQLVIAPVVSADFCEVTQLDDSERGDGGFGHTGIEASGEDP